MDFKDRLYSTYVSGEQAGAEAVGQLRAGRALLAGNAAYANQLIARFFPTDRGIRILDLGCGHGTYLYFLKRKGYHNLVGVDTSAEQVALAHRLGVEEVQLADIQLFLAHDEHPADVVLLMDVLEHMPLQVVFDLLDNLFAKLSKGGRLLIHVPNAEGIFGMRIRYGDLTHEQAFTPSSIAQLLRSTGFRSVSCIEDKPAVHGPTSLARRIIWAGLTAPFRLLLMAETGCTRFILSQNMLVVAQK